LSFKKHITYHGLGEEIPAIPKSLDIFVVPSILPGQQQTVILEGMASATIHG